MLIVGFDFHGVLDTYPEMQKLARLHWANDNDKVYIITGLKATEAHEELNKIGFSDYDGIYSIVDHLTEKGVTVEWDENGRPWADKEHWNNAKKEICEANNVHIMYDDSPRYKDTFNDISTIYCHVINPTRVIYKVREDD